MNQDYCCDLKDLLNIFEERLSASDILSAKVLSEISSNIVKCRIELGMTQKEFAQYMNVSQGMVSKWESEDYNFSIKALADIAVKLNLELSVRMQKEKIVKNMEDSRQFRGFTSTERPLFVINNCSGGCKSNRQIIRYMDHSDILKIIVQ